MNKKISLIIALTLLSQVLLLYKTVQLGNGEYTGYIIETLVLLIVTGLFLAKFVWARWLLLVVSVLLAFMSVAGALQHADYSFYFIAILQGAVAWYAYSANLEAQSS
jgi:hypothetical protein